MEQFENSEAQSIRTEAREMATWLQNLDLTRREELFDETLTADERELVALVSDPNNTDEFLVMNEDKRQLVREAFEKLKAAL